MNVSISRNTVLTPEGETLTVCVRKNTAASGTISYGVFIDGGYLANGSDIVWATDVKTAMQRAADEAYSIIIGM